MGDYITNKATRYTICPKCKNHTLKVTTWEEHLEGWGFDSYKIEYYGKCYCETCKCSFDCETLEIQK